MAKNCSVLSIRSNVIEENRKILNELRNQHQVQDKSERDLIEFFEKLNCKNTLKKGGNEDMNFTWHTKQDVNYMYGPIEGFPPGSWWGILMDCARDHVHNSFDSDVQIGPAGATSICTSQMNTKDDIDLGDFLTITGERFSEGTSREDPLIQNYKNQIPVRLIRSYNLSNPFAPKTGYRYDGLYIIIAYWIGVSSNNIKHNKFAVMRLPGQKSPPWYHGINASIKSPDFTALRPSLKTNGHYLHSLVSEKEQTCLGNESKQNNAVTLTEQQKNVFDGVIVKRQAFTKTHNELDSLNIKNSTSLSSELSTHFKVHGSKAQSTNISIRTDLYDSSHNFQQDVKKNSFIFYKSCTSTTPKQTVQYPENSSTLQCNKVNKINAKPNASENNTNSELNNTFTNKENTQSTTMNLTSTVVQSSDSESTSNDRKRTCSGQLYTVRFSKRTRRDNSLSKDIVKMKLSNETLDDHENLCELVSIGEKSMDAYAHEASSLESLDSLTPDTILKLIDRETRHPLSQFLIDSMIGLGPEESLKLRSCVSMRSQIDSKNNVTARKSRLNTKNVKNTLHKYSVSERNCKFNRHKSRSELSSELNNPPRVQTYKRILRNRTAKNINFTKIKHETLADKKSTMKLQSKTMCKRYNLSNNSKNRNEKNVVRDNKATRISTRASGSSLRDKCNTKYNVKREINRKSSKNVEPIKHTRQRREITNLLIDAKITPLARGPRNRRLRCINTAYNKKHCFDSSFKSLFCNVKKQKIGTKKSKRQSEFRKQSKLSEYFDRLKRARRQNSNCLSTVTKTKRDNSLNSNKSNSTKTKITNSIEKKGIKILKNSINKNVKEVTKCPTSIENPCCASKWKSLCCLHSEKITKPPAADAMVQCSFPTELVIDNPSDKSSRMTFLDRKNDKENIVKIEKSCASEETNFDPLEDKRQGKNQSASDFVVNTNDQDVHVVSSQKISAFAPVDTFNSDLRIARLRSLAFKPIKSSSIDEQTSNSINNDTETNITDERNGSSTRMVVDRDAQEEYSKYTNEENSLVGYMDEELSYLDIEDEDAEKPMVSIPIGNDQTISANEVSWNELSMEQDLDLPWHGWRKVVSKGQSFWVGW